MFLLEKSMANAFIYMYLLLSSIVRSSYIKLQTLIRKNARKNSKARYGSKVTKNNY